MDNKTLQKHLVKVGLYSGKVDGSIGPLTEQAINAFLMSEHVDCKNWVSKRKLIAAKQLLAKISGVDPGVIDGLAGSQTTYAFEVLAARQKGDTSLETFKDDDILNLATPPPKAKVWPVQKDVTKFFGQPGANQTKLEFPYPMKIAWNKRQTVKSTSCHELIVKPAARVFDRVLDHYGLEKIKELKLDLFGGCLNVRRMRGGTAWSMHSWGIAFDFDPENNQLRWNHSKATFAKPQYEKWFDLWAEEGAVSLGRAKDYDWMHTQFARL